MRRLLSFTATRAVRAGVGALLLGAWIPGWAGDESLPPPGFQWGPLFVAPSLATGIFANSNPFYRSTYSIAPGEQTGDILAVLNPAIVATLPFRNSWFRFAYDGVFRDYRDPDVASNNSQDVVAELSLLFSSFDRATFRVDRFHGAADTIRFDGGEAVYDGTPFDFATYEGVVERQVPGHPGYAANLRWSRLTFDSTDYAFFEYDGWEGACEARFAVSPTTWIVAGGAFRRFDHRLANDPTHAVYRQEDLESVQVGAQGSIVHSQSWRVVLRYDRGNYPGGTGSNFRGLGGEAGVFLALGPSSTLSLVATRRTWSSFYQDNNYYLATVIGARWERLWMKGSNVGVAVDLGKNDYPDTVFDPLLLVDLTRHDRAIRAEFYANLAFRAAYALRFSLLHLERSSNAGGVDYRANSVGVQFVLGWR